MEVAVARVEPRVAKLAKIRRKIRFVRNALNKRIFNAVVQREIDKIKFLILKLPRKHNLIRTGTLLRNQVLTLITKFQRFEFAKCFARIKKQSRPIRRRMHRVDASLEKDNIGREVRSEIREIKRRIRQFVLIRDRTDNEKFAREIVGHQLKGRYREQLKLLRKKRYMKTSELGRQNYDETKPNLFSILPVELRYKILSYLDRWNTLKARSVCQEWNAIVMDRRKRRKFEDRFVTCIDLQEVSTCINRCGMSLCANVCLERRYVVAMIQRLEEIVDFFQRYKFTMEILVKNWHMRDHKERERERPRIMEPFAPIPENQWHLWHGILIRLATVFRMSRNIGLSHCQLPHTIWAWLFSRCDLHSFKFRRSRTESPGRDFHFPSPLKTMPEKATITTFFSQDSYLENYADEYLIWLSNVTTFAFVDKNYEPWYVESDGFQQALGAIFLKGSQLPKVARMEMESLFDLDMIGNLCFTKRLFTRLFQRPHLHTVRFVEHTLRTFESLKRTVQAALPPDTQMFWISNDYVIFCTGKEFSHPLQVHCFYHPRPADNLSDWSESEESEAEDAENLAMVESESESESESDSETEMESEDEVEEELEEIVSSGDEYGEIEVELIQALENRAPILERP